MFVRFVVDYYSADLFESFRKGKIYDMESSDAEWAIGEGLAVPATPAEVERASVEVR